MDNVFIMFMRVKFSSKSCVCFGNCFERYNIVYKRVMILIYIVCDIVRIIYGKWNLEKV